MRSKSLDNLSIRSWMEGQKRTSKKQSQNSKKSGERQGKSDHSKTQSRPSKQKSKRTVLNCNRTDKIIESRKAEQSAAEMKKRAYGVLFEAQVLCGFAKLANANTSLQRSTKFTFKERTNNQFVKEFSKRRQRSLRDGIEHKKNLTKSIEIDLMMETNQDRKTVIENIQTRFSEFAGNNNFWFQQNIFKQRTQASKSHFVFEMKRNFFPQEIQKQNSQKNLPKFYQLQKIQKNVEQLKRIVDFVQCLTQPQQNQGHYLISDYLESDNFLYNGKKLVYCSNEQNKIPKDEKKNVEITLVIDKGIRSDEFRTKLENEILISQMNGLDYLKKSLDRQNVIVNVMGFTDLSQIQKELEKLQDKEKSEWSHMQSASEGYTKQEMEELRKELLGLSNEKDEQNDKIRKLENELKELKKLFFASSIKTKEQSQYKVEQRQ